MEPALSGTFLCLSGLNVELRRSNTSWVLANLNVTGYYRVNYDPENWERLLAQLGSEPQVKRAGLLLLLVLVLVLVLCSPLKWLPPVAVQLVPLLNRAQLLDDAFSLAR